MSSFRHPARRDQAGLTLISMMVGLVISLLAIASLLAVYRLVIDASGNAVGSIQRDGQVASALLAAQIELQQAGYGIERAAGPAETALLSIADDEVTWRFRPTPGAADLCAGLRLATGDGGGGLLWLPPRACTDAAATTWDAADVRPLTTRTAFFAPRARDGSVLTDEVGAAVLQGARFELDGTCTLAYAQQAFDADDTHPLAQRLLLRGGDGRLLLPACLSNIAVDVHTPDPGASP
ncbi:prepilin-type N-terminal cleavage/methylation domain-containing protein [Luteimonas sp. XNQY3]|nr:prepilin-type N-terminal cleavage/methylation domain-containing protein [Luteimonas sp. XNQY3]MCD9004674.1 prepilin-type N-terminal cleavage/methylation domain-containing protein [Luteimonas sp. XNQY3]